MGIELFLGLGGVIGAFLGGAAVAEHQQQVAAAVQGGCGHGADDSERLAGVVDDLFYRGHRITGRESLAETGADQQIAFLDVRRIGDMTQFQALRVAGAAGNRAQTVTVHLHRNAVGGVGQQQDTRGVRHQFNHLAHQPACIEHRLAEHHAVALTFVDDDAMGKGVGVHADQLGHFDLFIDQCGGIEQLAQPNVLLGQGRELLHASLQQQVFGLEFFVFGDELGAAAELTGDPFPQAAGQVGDPVGIHEHQRRLLARGLEQVETCIDHHQCDREHGQHQQAHAQRRAFGEKRFNKPLLPGKCSVYSYGIKPAWMKTDRR